MTPAVTSVFLYVADLQKSVEFYHEIMLAEIVQLLAEVENGPLTLAILRIGQFSLMLHPQDESAGEIPKNKLGIHLQLRVDSVDAFHHHCDEQGATAKLHGDPVDQPWGWREFYMSDPDGFIWSIYQDNSNGQWF